MAEGQGTMREWPSRNPLRGLHWGWRRRLPVILQTEAAECGLACMVMIARYHGHGVDLQSLRRRFTTSLKGANLARVIAVAADLGFTTRPLRLELNQLNQLKAPCILHWDLNHFVVLKRVGARHIFIHDPARGERRVTLSETSDRFTGVALELMPAADFQQVEARERISLRKLTGHVHGLTPSILQILALALAMEVFSLVGPFYMQWVIDDVLVSADQALLTLLGLGFLGIIVFQTLFAAARSWSITYLGATLNIQWVNNVFGHMLNLPLSWFESRHMGDVVSRFDSIQAIQHTLTTQFIGSLLDGLVAVVTLVVLCLYSIPLALLVLGAFVLYGVLRWAFFRPLYRINEDQIVYQARLQSELMESIRGILPIKLGNRQSERRARYANATVEAINRNIGVQRLTITFNVFNRLIFGVTHIAIIWMAAVMVLGGAFTAGMLVAFVAYTSHFHTRAAALIDKLIQFWMLTLHAHRVADIALSKPEPAITTAWSNPVADASIEVKNVSFRYADGEPWVLKGCSFRIKAGQSVAIVGPSGGGKTTLAKLMLGLFEPTEGQILFGGVDICKLGPEAYREAVGAVMQDDQLFAGSLADNIAFFEPHMTHEKVEAAARTAAIHDDIAAMPMAYQTLVGDMGSSLSGGQKQRVILARALYRQPKLLMLDEATSHLDVQLERQVNDAIQRLKLTRVVIAHRPQTTATAQITLELTNGVVRRVSPSLRTNTYEVSAGTRANNGPLHF